MPVRKSLIGRAARTAGRTALIAGTAAKVSSAVARSGPGSSAVPAPKQAAPSGDNTLDDKMARLKDLEGLRKAGTLSQSEFDKLKAEILSG